GPFFSIVAAGPKEPGGKARPQPFSIGDTGVVYLLLALTSGGGGGQEAGALVHRRRSRPQPSSPSISQGRRMEKPGETCSSSPHPSSKPPPAPEAKFSRRSGSPAIRTPSICSSWPAWQPTGRSSAALLLAPRRDCRGSNPSTPWIKDPSTRRSHLHLRLRICIIHVCTKPAAALILSSSSHSPSTIGKGPGVGNCPGAEQRPRNESSDEEKAMAPLFIFGGVLSTAGGEAGAVRSSPAPSR
ncbi:hypothetical protein PVAP13_6KG233700, partial [Panicum virgatum]